MFNGKLFSKIFGLIGITLFLSATLTLGVYMGISKKIYISSKISELRTIGESVVELISVGEEVSINHLKNILDSNMNFADTKIEVYDKNANPYMFNREIDQQIESSRLSYIRPLIKQKIINKNKERILGDVLSGEEVIDKNTEYIIVGLPVFNEDDNVIAAVILTRAISVIDYSTNGSLYFTLIISTFGVFLLMLLPAYLIVRKIVMPLRQMTTVANYMAKGDFSKRADENIKGEVGELAKAINTCAKESEKLEMTRRDYVANVSHELRTPIASMRVIGETLKDGLVKDDNKKQKYYDSIVKESIRLSNLVDDLLELSRLQSGNYIIEKKRFYINEILDNVNDIYSNISKDKNIGFCVKKFDRDVEVFSNSEKIEQILIILVDNAFKNTKEGNISVFVKDAKDKIILSVVDTGCGIDVSDIEHIFERFYKADKSHSSDGSGLGLSIAKEILDVMGEEIWVESQIDKGSTFSFTIHKLKK